MKSSRAIIVLVAVLVFLTATSYTAFAIAIDLSAALTGPIIIAPGGSFSQGFVGQTVAGQNLNGSPDDPLTLQQSGTLKVEFFNGSNTILPQPENKAPLALLLDAEANFISWFMGFGDPPSDVTIDFYEENGSLVHSMNQPILDGYNSYTFSGFGAFRGLAIYNNDDFAGLRYYRFEYNLDQPVPDSGSAGMLFLMGIIGFSLTRVWSLTGLLYKSTNITHPVVPLSFLG
ncbi:MAG TPA: hypothetical protein P5186_17540 [Candidatus Paceibacterota bacterium]|nr:hypothetical protein [Verrucomicrobiota bacterium]HRY49855.1 hypothetical protein [Candidatus Paceibacterota bacterium]